MFNPKKLEKIMKERDISQYKLSKMLSTDSSNISALLSGKIKSPKINFLNRICTALGIEVKAILDNDEKTRSTDEENFISHQDEKISYEEFLKMNININSLEYIDGKVYSLGSPNEEHQRILINLATEFGLYFREKEAKPYLAPFPVIFTDREEALLKRVQPDLLVIRNKSGLNEHEYVGTPELIIEVVSPSNSSHDYTVKFNLYRRVGVKEYWIVNPKTRSVQIFFLDAKGLYDQAGIYKDTETIESAIFTDLLIDLKTIFI